MARCDLNEVAVEMRAVLISIRQPSQRLAHRADSIGRVNSPRGKNGKDGKGRGQRDMENQDRSGESHALCRVAGQVGPHAPPLAVVARPAARIRALCSERRLIVATPENSNIVRANRRGVLARPRRWPASSSERSPDDRTGRGPRSRARPARSCPSCRQTSSASGIVNPCLRRRSSAGGSSLAASRRGRIFRSRLVAFNRWGRSTKANSISR